jgi:hypothetical protein
MVRRASARTVTGQSVSWYRSNGLAILRPALVAEKSMHATTELLDRLAEVPSLDNRRDAVSDALASARLEG